MQIALSKREKRAVEKLADSLESLEDVDPAIEGMIKALDDGDILVTDDQTDGHQYIDIDEDTAVEIINLIKSYASHKSLGCSLPKRFAKLLKFREELEAEKD